VPHSAPILAAVLALASACAAPGHVPADSRGPYVLVLGTAQDGGLPQVGCLDEPCERARRDPERRRNVSSLLLCDPRSGRRWLIDCTPDLRTQVEEARGHPSTRVAEGQRPALFDGIFLTHAHLGHYAGLLELGREAYGAREVPTWLTPRFAAFLRANGPWSLLVEAHHLSLRELAPGTPVSLAEDLAVVPFLVPHRDEFSDTVGLEIRGPRRRLLYLPDVDKWEALDAREGPRSIERRVAAADAAWLDGSFHADGEIPGRSMADIPHPFLRESLARFAALPASERAKIAFTHLNHTNPAADPASAAAREVRAAGMQVLAEGTRLEL